jgi:membrane-bound lytic murein transglycosylase D
MRKLILLTAITIFSTCAFGQEQNESVVIDSVEVAIAEEEMLYKTDTADYVYYSLPSALEYVPGDDHPALVADRLSCLEKAMPLEYNDKIHAFINYFTIRDREYTKMVVRRKNLYFPLFEKYLAKYGMPDELKYLSIIESGLNPRAISRARAVGLWQFMSATGRYYGLANNRYIDDRMDPEKSTDAACRYLKDLYNMFHDWELALAAYNTGPGNVKKAIRRSGYKNTFWEIYPQLPRETRAYVPQFVAMIYTMNYLDEHNFYNEGEEMPVVADTIMVNKHLHFETFAAMTGTCLEDLQKLNPSILYSAVPESGKSFALRIPATAKEKLMENRLAILDSSAQIGKKQLELIAKTVPEEQERIVYKVRRGDVLGSIAMRHRVTVSQLKKWNNLRGTNINIGQRLTIYGKGHGPKSSGQTTTAVAKKTTTPKKVSSGQTYTVQPGDTLWTISKKFDGLTIEKLKSLNNLQNNKIQAGQKLIIGI